MPTTFATAFAAHHARGSTPRPRDTTLRRPTRVHGHITLRRPTMLHRRTMLHRNTTVRRGDMVRHQATTTTTRSTPIRHYLQPREDPQGPPSGLRLPACRRRRA